MARSLEAKSIKSAQRVFEVLEYFDFDHPEASVTDISRRYGYPQSSASELLSYMVHLGYLRRGSRNRSFRLSMRVAMLGVWVQPELVRNGRLLRLIDDLADETGATVVLATNTGVRLQCLHVVRRDRDAPHQGDLLRCSARPRAERCCSPPSANWSARSLHRLNSEAEDESDRIRFDDLAADLDASSARGYVRMVDERGSAFSVLIPNADLSVPLALCVRAPVVPAKRPSSARSAASFRRPLVWSACRRRCRPTLRPPAEPCSWRAEREPRGLRI